MHGRKPGRTVWISAAVHGDEIAGVEIIRRVTRSLNARTMSGTLIAVPIVNVHGFLNGDRYLPDRRDLNRSFPGSANGSLAARIANLFMTEIVKRCDVGIDLHTGSDHRTNLPHVRGDLDDPTTRKLAEAFGAPLMLHATVARRIAARRGDRERGDDAALRRRRGLAVRHRGASTSASAGIRRVLAELAMIDPDDDGADAAVRSRAGGAPGCAPAAAGWRSCRPNSARPCERGELLGVIHDSVGKRLSRITAPRPES